MSATELTEVFQWIAIGLVFLLNAALYRQFGLLMVDSHTLQTEAFGPAVGARVNRRLTSAFPQPLRDWNLLVFVLESCKTCDQFLDGLQEAGALARADIQVVLAYRGNSALGELFSRRYPSCVNRPSSDVLGPNETLSGREITGYPFALLVDEHRILAAKSLGNDAQPILDVIQQTHKSAMNSFKEQEQPVGAST